MCVAQFIRAMKLDVIFTFLGLVASIAYRAYEAYKLKLFSAKGKI